jgi:dTMP kinase
VTPFVAVEGLDGSGKTTQADLIVKTFRQTGRDAELIHFPRYDSAVWGPAISKFLRGDFGPVDDVHPWLVAQLFAGDRAEAAKDIRRLLSHGVVVVADRYLFSNFAFQGAKLGTQAEQEEFQHWLWTLEVELNQVPLPDVSLFLDVPLPLIEERLSAARPSKERTYLDGRADIHESDFGLQMRVRERYLELAEVWRDIEIVDCGQLMYPHEIQKQVSKALSRRGLLGTSG